MALCFILRALNIRAGFEIVVPALTFWAEFDSLITVPEEGVLGACRRPTRLCQHPSQPPVALSGFPTSAFAGTFVVTRTDRRPRCQMMTVGKGTFGAHVHSRL